MKLMSKWSDQNILVEVFFFFSFWSVWVGILMDIWKDLIMMRYCFGKCYYCVHYLMIHTDVMKSFISLRQKGKTTMQMKAIQTLLQEETGGKVWQLPWIYCLTKKSCWWCWDNFFFFNSAICFQVLFITNSPPI